MKNRFAIVACAVAALAGCAHTYGYREPVYYAPAPVVYYYDPPTVYFVANCLHWPPARVEYYFIQGWGPSDLIIAYEVSRASGWPWWRVARAYDYEWSSYHRGPYGAAVGPPGGGRYRTVGPPAVAPEGHRGASVEERQQVWARVAAEAKLPEKPGGIGALARDPEAFPQIEKQLMAKAVAEQYHVAPAQAERLLDKGYDVAEVVNAYDKVKGGDEPRPVEAVVHENHQAWVHKEERVASGETGGMPAPEAAPAASWSPEKEAAAAKLVNEAAPESSAAQPEASAHEMAPPREAAPHPESAPRFEPAPPASPSPPNSAPMPETPRPEPPAPSEAPPPPEPPSPPDPQEPLTDPPSSPKAERATGLRLPPLHAGRV